MDAALLRVAVACDGANGLGQKHLVLSTLHTNDSVSAVTRLLDLGIPGCQIAAALTGVIAQRLVRRLCNCCYSSTPTPEYLNSLMMAGMMEPPAVQNTPSACEECDFSGYRGRAGIYELLVFNDPIRQATRSGNQNDESRASRDVPVRRPEVVKK